MAEREKVTSGIEYCLLRSQERVHCGDCPYWYDDFESGCHVYDMMRDALALLKEQEAKMVVETTSTIRCPKCGKQITSKGAIHREIKYCWKCGQAVKWDET